jgi:hypothetical protein
MRSGLALSGPFTDRETWRSSFLHDVPYVDFSQPPPRPDAALHAAAARLTQVPGHRPITEATWPTTRYGGRRFALAQPVHGRRVIVVAPGLAGHRRVAFRSFVGPDPRALLATDARFLVVHGPAVASSDEWPRRLHRELGPPAWRDGDVQAWDLDAARKRS